MLALRSVSRGNLMLHCAYNLPQVAHHLTPKEDRYGNEEGKEEIQQRQKQLQ